MVELADSLGRAAKDKADLVVAEPEHVAHRDRVALGLRQAPDRREQKGVLDPIAARAGRLRPRVPLALLLNSLRLSGHEAPAGTRARDHLVARDGEEPRRDRLGPIGVIARKGAIHLEEDVLDGVLRLVGVSEPHAEKAVDPVEVAHVEIGERGIVGLHGRAR